MSSEFGRGYITCLYQFDRHTGRLDEFLQMYERVGGERDYGLSAVEMWANGASDHLYELILPRRVIREDRDLARLLASQALDAGHGFHINDHPYSEADARRWIGWARQLITAAEVRVGFKIDSLDQAVKADEMLGLRRIDIGTWACP